MIGDLLLGSEGQGCSFALAAFGTHHARQTRPG
ncbi:hypothetical protein [Dactylosporangium sp. AC04546]